MESDMMTAVINNNEWDLGFVYTASFLAVLNYCDTYAATHQVMARHTAQRFLPRIVPRIPYVKLKCLA